jgi:transcription-repair coupling factor (superfamily II helicase)
MEPPLPASIGRLVAARQLKEVANILRDQRAAAVSGLWGASVAAVIAAIRAELNRPTLLICGHLDEAEDLADDIELFSGRRPEILPALELAASLGRASEEQVSNRLRLIARLAASSGSWTDSGVLIASIQSLMQSVPSPGQLQQLMLALQTGQKLEPEKLIVWLAEHGYSRLEQVEVPGDFAVRGGIIDIYLPGIFAQAGEQFGLTVRVDFFDDKIESIRRFDLDSLGSGEAMPSVSVIDIKGQLPETGESTSLFSYLPSGGIVALWAPLEIAEQSKSYLDRLSEVKGIYPLGAVLQLASQFTRVELSQFDQQAMIIEESAPHIRLPVASLQRFETEAKRAIKELAEVAETHDVSIFCENDGERQRFKELIDAEVPGLSDRIEAFIGYLHRGFVWDYGAVRKPAAFLGHHELFHRYEQRRRVGKVIASRPVDSFLDLNEGDYVVHVAHGIAKFTGMHAMTRDGRARNI